MAESTSKKLQCVIVTPETTVLDQPVEFVAVPLFDGELGVLPGRAPLVARLGYGELRTQADSAKSSYYIDGGFLQVNKNVVSVLTPRATTAGKIDLATARTELEAANREIPTTPDAAGAKVISLSRARGKLTVARRAGRS